MAVSAVVSIGVPVFLFVYVYKKFDGKIFPMILGAAAFVVFVLVIERFIHLKVANLDELKKTPALYILYGGFMAGIFEETARFICFNILKKKKYGGIGTGLSYGVGHGGIEAVLLAGTGMIANIVFCVLINTGNVGILTGNLQGDMLEQMNAALEILVTTSPSMFLVGGLERLFAVTIQLGLSVMVFYAVYGQRKFWLFPLAVLFHAVIDFPAAAYQAGALKSMVPVEGLVAAAAVLITIFAVILHRKYKEELL
jgi:uncharacterized membrane protein YhfC